MTSLLRRLFRSRRSVRVIPPRPMPAITELDLLRALGCDE